MVVSYFIHQCDNHHCQLRFPVTALDPHPYQCPLCGGSTNQVKIKPPVKQIILSHGSSSELILEGFLDNLRSLHNVGSIFRSANGAGIKHLYLGGITPTPEHPQFTKAALGAEKTVSWRKDNNGLARAKNLKRSGYSLWALENNPSSESLFKLTHRPEQRPVLLIVGNELVGIDPEILRLCEKTFFIPMQGSKGSLNVAVAFGIAAYHLRFGTK